MTTYVKWDDVEDLAGELADLHPNGVNNSFENGVLALFDALKARRVEEPMEVHGFPIEAAEHVCWNGALKPFGALLCSACKTGTPGHGRWILAGHLSPHRKADQ